jgi:NAD(P)-dependent dehydrogenase (short-subunit alcohol dehydrogenase family)
MGRALESKVALVTGASSGIGRGIARGLAEEGAAIILASRRIDELDALAGQIRAIGSDALPVAVDLCDECQVVKLFERSKDAFGALDILVNCAGISGSSPIKDFSTELWDRIISVNLRAPFLCTREAMKIMIAQGRGRIINIGSSSAKRVRPNSAAYSASKHGLWGLTQVAALEGRSHGVTCCCVHPGRVRVERPPSHPGAAREPTISVDDVVKTVVHIASLPSDVNMLETVILPREQPFLGRG